MSAFSSQAEARLAAKRAARAEARDIRMRELERQQKEEESERARYSHRSSHHRSYLNHSSYSHSYGKKRYSASPKDPLASLYDGGLYKPYGSRTPSEYSYYSSRTSSARSSPVFIDDDTESIVSSDRASHGRRESVVSVVCM